MQAPTRVVLAFDSWKESLSAIAACDAAAAGLERLGPRMEAIRCPLSDGGEGFVQTVAQAGGGSIRTHAVTGPLFEPVPAQMAWMAEGRCAVVEAAEACGLARVPAPLRDPGKTTTAGLGELLKHAADMGAREIVVGLGGSATNDAGLGLLSALGWRFLDRSGQMLPAVGHSLSRVERIVPGESLKGVRLIAACDVTNPLFGVNGAARVYAPQKGATAERVAELDAGLEHFAGVCSAFLGKDLSGEPGAGAAGGLGFALQAFLGADFRSGAAVSIRLSRLAAHLDGAGFCLTGEGRTDFQTACGKLPAVVAGCCREADVPCVCLSGALGERWHECYAAGFAAILSVIQRPVALEEAIRDTPEMLADAAEAMGRLFLERCAGRRGVGPWR